MTAQLNDLVQNKPLLPQDNPVLNGNFGPVDEELTLTELEICGELPEQLAGTTFNAIASRNRLRARALFSCCDLLSSPMAISPLGLWRRRTAELVLLRFCPPGPDAR